MTPPIEGKRQEASSEITVWERVATTSWGKYVTAVESDILQSAEKLAAPPARALEVGCEGGRWSKMLADLNWKMTCTDISRETLDVCKRKVPAAECILVDATARTLPAESGAFSLLLCIEVPPVIQSDWFLAEAFRALRGGGILAGTFLNRSSWRGMQGRLRANLAGGGDRRFYVQSYPRWKKNLLKQEFELVRELGFCWAPFSRASDSRLVPLATRMERWFGLNHLPSVSPWVGFIARKRA